MSEAPQPGSKSDNDAPEVAAALFGDIYNRFIHLVLYARTGLGSWGPQNELTDFTVFLGEPTLVRINQEPQVWTTPIAQRSFAPGDTVEPSDLLTEPRPLAGAATDRPSINAHRHKAGWRLEFDFAGARVRSAELLAVADEFLNTARWSLEQNHLRAFVENGFHAAEAFAKAELLAYPVTASEVEGSRKHSGVLSAYHLWARLGNTDPRFPALLQELLETRRAGTYADGRFNGDDRAAREQLDVLLEMQHHVDQTLKGAKGGVVTVIATREIRAGELINVADATIRPPKAPRGQPSS
jgi:uncharacterized protein (UPF0332 family)